MARNGLYFEDVSLIEFIANESNESTALGVKAAKLALRDTADYLAELLEEEYIKKDKRASGTLIDSIDVKEIDNGFEVAVLADYAPAVEWGSKPHYPPVAPIRIWCARKLGDEGATWRVIHKIATKGIKPTPVFAKSFAKIEKFFLKRFNVYFNKLVVED